jgi:polysaccharide biosynthesis/export protein
MTKYIVLIFGFFLLLYSCVPNKRITYLQNLDGVSPIPEGQLINYQIPEYKLQYNDILDVQIKTPDPEVNELFANQQQNLPGMQQITGQTGGDVYYMTGYTVNKEGYIRLPLLGQVFVRESTIDQARESIENQLKEYVKGEFFVKVKLGGIRYAAFGEFRKPGKYVVLQDRMTIFEAIANAGDITTVGRRNELVLIRQFPEGSAIYRVDLNDRNIISSPYYFIQPNDQLYVEPMKVRELGTGENTAQTMTLVISSITALALVINLIAN